MARERTARKKGRSLSKNIRMIESIHNTKNSNNKNKTNPNAVVCIIQIRQFISVEFIYF